MTPLQKYRLKMLAGWLGLSTRSVQRRRSSMLDFCAHLRRRDYAPDTVIDVGVADGTFELYTALPDAKYLLVEPMAEFEPALTWIASRYDARYELVAAGAADERRLIRLGASLEDKHGAALVAEAQRNSADSAERREIPVRRLDRLVVVHGLEGPSLIKADTQGTEPEVIAGAESILPQTGVVILEVSLYRFALGGQQPLIDDVLSFMIERGFFPYDIFGANYRPLDDALAQVDIAFVREDGPFRRDHRFSDPGLPVALWRRGVRRLRRLLNV